MDKITVERYNPALAGEWDSFVDMSRNSTFLFRRDYMDYHADRFDDCSWIVRKKGKPIAMLPANITPDGVLHSHGGLTYGGFMLPQSHVDGSDVLRIFSCCIAAWREMGIKALDYKPLPHIYAASPSQEDEYALFRLGAVATERCISSTIDMHRGWMPNKLQKRHLAAASKLPVTIAETDDIPAFMAMLHDCLRERHNTAPVHTADEMSRLKTSFAANIRFFVASIDGLPHAGVCVYDTGIVAHAQYIATTARGRELNLLTPLFHHLITSEFANRRYFDFGISTEQHGTYLNEGLLRQKTSYGAGATIYSRFILDLSPVTDLQALTANTAPHIT